MIHNVPETICLPFCRWVFQIQIHPCNYFKFHWNFVQELCPKGIIGTGLYEWLSGFNCWLYNNIWIVFQHSECFEYSTHVGCYVYCEIWILYDCVLCDNTRAVQSLPLPNKEQKQYHRDLHWTSLVKYSTPPDYVHGLCFGYISPCLVINWFYLFPISLLLLGQWKNPKHLGKWITKSMKSR